MMQAMMEMQQNPAAAMKYMQDPEVGPFLMKMAGMAAGGMGGGNPGMGGFGGQPNATSAPTANFVDVEEMD